MTSTAIELWNDERFLEKRIDEQVEYIKQTFVRREAGEITDDRHEELLNSAQQILRKLVSRGFELHEEKVKKHLNSHVA